MSSHHDIIVKEAYYLWEKAGKPHGRDVDFWVQAELMVAKKSGKMVSKTSSETKKTKKEIPSDPVIGQDKPKKKIQRKTKSS